MIALSKKDMKTIWEYVKQIRADYLWNLHISLWYSCSSLINEGDIKSNFENLAEILNLPDVTEEVLDLDIEKIEEGAKMFLYLNLCPSSITLEFKQIFRSLNAYTVIMSTMKFLKSSEGKTLDKIIQIFNGVSNIYGNS